MKIITTEKKVIKSWCENPEDSAIEQAKNLANLPFIFKHVALMPDTHMGYGMPIGGVIATSGVVIPNAVGVDIGCGMLAIRTSLTEISTEDLKKVMGLIREKVPVGFNHHKEAQNEKLMPVVDYPEFQFFDPIIVQEHKSALKQLGTLGGGNHFIEIQKGDDGCIWFMIHSGSRNLGYRVAKYYNDLAKKLNEKWLSSVSAKHDLAFLPLDTAAARRYLIEMNYCLEFALSNRELMAKRVIESFYKVFGYEIVFDLPINIHHNYARMENHYGVNVMVHRKGATSARDGELGIIPGSQGTSSYIIKGKGSELSFKSCSHGAGRKMGRKEAQRTIDIEQELKILSRSGVLHSIRTKKDLDEAPSAYKDIDVVMNEQKDLIDVITKLTPLGVIKG